MKNEDLTFWKGEKNRLFGFYKPCSCGCDLRDGKHTGWEGYYSASDSKGKGFSLWIKKRKVK